MTPVAFADLSKSCAPMVAVEMLAAVVSVESGFSPFAIRVNTDHRLPASPQSKREAIEAATALVAAGADIDLGLGGINISKLQEHGVSITDAFDPCTNLKITGTLLHGYFQIALKSGAIGDVAERMMLTAYYGGGDREGGELAGFDKQVLSERSRLAHKIAGLTIGPTPATGAFVRRMQAAASADVPETSPKSPADARERDVERPQSGWDVFSAHRNSSTLILQKERQ